MAERNSNELPPSYEQSLGHRRLEGGYVLPLGYSIDGAGYPDRLPRRSRRNQRPEAPREFRLPSTDFTRGTPPVIVRDDSTSTVSSTDEETKTCLKLALPPMHMCIAITCLILNIITPGIGTILAGWGVFCCTKSDGWVAKEKCISCSLNFVVGLLQIILIPVILLGWIWSVIWGFALLGVSLDEYHGMKDEDDDEESSRRPRSALFRRVPPLSVTRQAMRQTTSTVSIAPSTGNRSDVTAVTVCPSGSGVIRAREESELPDVHSSPGRRSSRVTSRQASSSISQHSSRPNTGQSHVGRGVSVEAESRQSTPGSRPVSTADEQRQGCSGTPHDASRRNSNSNPVQADVHHGDGREIHDEEYTPATTDVSTYQTDTEANDMPSGSFSGADQSNSISDTATHIATSRPRQDDGMSEVNM